MSDEPENDGGERLQPPPAPPGPDPLKLRKRRKSRRPIGSSRRYRRHIDADVPVAHEVGVGSSPRGEARAKPARESEDDTMGSITRQSLEDRQVTTFDLPIHRRKPGWDYQWQVVTIIGQRVDRSILRDAHKAGWRPEKAKDWPEIGEGLLPDDPIEEGGQMLMGRPQHLSNEAQVEGYNRAKTQERDRMQAASTGQSLGGNEGLSQIRGVRVANQSLNVELAVGSGPVGKHA